MCLIFHVERKEQVEKAEEKQRLENEKEEKLRKEAAEIANKEISKIEQELHYERSIGLSEEKDETKVAETLEQDRVGLLVDSPSDVGRQLFLGLIFNLLMLHSFMNNINLRVVLQFLQVQIAFALIC